MIVTYPTNESPGIDGTKIQQCVQDKLYEHYKKENSQDVAITITTDAATGCVIRATTAGGICVTAALMTGGAGLPACIPIATVGCISGLGYGLAAPTVISIGICVANGIHL